MGRRGGKYGNRRTVVDGITFASRREAARYGELKLLAQAGAVRDLRLQVRYPLVVGGLLVCHYVADFVYWDRQSKSEVVEDVKGYRTDVYALKAKLMRACHGITIREV
jgi:hypothetical protein